MDGKGRRQRTRRKGYNTGENLQYLKRVYTGEEGEYKLRLGFAGEKDRRGLSLLED